MKNVEERLRQLPEMASSAGLQADEALKRRIMQAARGKTQGRARARRLIPALCCALALLVGGGVYAAFPRGGSAPQEPVLLSSQPAGASQAPGAKLALDVPVGSISIRASSNPSYRSLWAPASGGNFPLIGVNGRYYRLLTNPTALTDSMLGDSLGTVDTYTSEPALAVRSGICSNAVNAGETVYAVRGMSGAAVAARVDGQLRAFQRVSFGDNALVGGETLADTLRAGKAVALELSGVGTINDAETAQRLIGVLTANASYQRAGSGETAQSLLIQLQNGLTLQMAVNGERLLACGTWACPEFFEAFQEALQ